MTLRRRGICLSVLVCLTYAFAYLCRINLSAAVNKMASGFGVGVSAIGIFGTLQTLIYAGGQLVNGYIISRHRPRLVILCAVIGSSCANLLMSLVNNYYAALVIWCANAYMQSLFWGAIIRIIDTYPESRSDTTVMWTILVLPISYTLSWSVIGQLLDSSPSWHPYFLIPGILLFLLIPFWISAGKICPETDTLQSAAVIRTPGGIFRYIFQNHVTVYCIVSVLSGIVREGILFWAPVLLARILAGSGISPYLTAPLIPFGRIPSTILLRLILPKFRNYLKINAWLFGLISAICFAVLLLPENAPIPAVILISLLTLLSTMLGSLFSVYVPLSYTHDNKSAPVAGLLDALIYLGGAVSTFVLGHILGSGSLDGAAVFWIITAVSGIIIPALMPKPIHKQ